MPIVVIALLHVVGIVLYFARPKLVFFYWLSVLSFGPAPMMLLTHNIDHFSFYSYFVQSWGRDYFLILVLISFFRTKSFPTSFKFIFIPLFVYVGYLFLWKGVTGTTPKQVWGATSEILSIFLPGVFFIQNKEALPDYKHFVRYIIWFFVVQGVFVCFNVIGITMYFMLYLNTNESIVTGTFARYNILANVLTTVYLFYSIEFFANKKIKTVSFLGLSVLIGVVVLLTGARMSVAIMGLTFIIVGFKYVNNHKALFISGIAAVCFVISVMLTLNAAKVKFGIVSIDRQIVGLTSFLQAHTQKHGEDGSTVGLSMYLLENYFDRSPIMGNGYEYKGERAYGNYGICVLEHFRADARLAFNIVEYGLVGFALQILCIISVFKLLGRYVAKNDRVKLWLIFCYFFILTLTEPGFFDRLCFPMTYMYVFGVLRNFS